MGLKSYLLHLLNNNITVVRSMFLLTSNLFAVSQPRNLIPFHPQKSLE